MTVLLCISPGALHGGEAESSSSTLRPGREATATGGSSQTTGSVTTAPAGQPSSAAAVEQREGESRMELEGTSASAEPSGAGASEPQLQGGPMDVATPSQEKEDEVRPKNPLDMESHPSFILESLSLQLHLDELWRALSECLDMLAQTNDPHAVLVLQPTVEAFFLVHANNTEENKPPKKSRSGSSRSRFGHLSSFRTTSESGSNPASPAPHMDVSPMPSTPGLGKGEDSYAHLPPDTARFLMFAGELYIIYTDSNLQYYKS